MQYPPLRDGGAEALRGASSCSHPPQSTLWCRRGDGHQSPTSAPPSLCRAAADTACDESIDCVCRPAPPRGLVRLNNPPAAVAAWPPAGITALGSQPQLPWEGRGCSAPSTFFHHSAPGPSPPPAWGPHTIPGAGGTFPGQEGFLTAAAVLAGTDSHGSQALCPVHGQILTPHASL